MINPGDRVPQFSLVSQFGKPVSSDDYLGQYVVYWWIPSTMADMTPACCDTIAKGFISAVNKHTGINIVGMSFDTPYEMKKFATRASILFPLLSDETKEVGQAFGVRRNDEWDVFPLKRAFLVGPDGLVVKRYDSIDPDFFVDEVVYDLNSHNVIEDEEPSLYRQLIGK